MHCVVQGHFVTSSPVLEVLAVHRLLQGRSWKYTLRILFNDFGFIKHGIAFWGVILYENVISHIQVEMYIPIKRFSSMGVVIKLDVIYGNLWELCIHMHWFNPGHPEIWSYLQLMSYARCTSGTFQILVFIRFKDSS